MDVVLKFAPSALLSLLFAGVMGCASSAPDAPRFAVSADAPMRSVHEASGTRWIASTQGRAATDAVERTYAQGGNIIDAAVAASLAISVERPHSTGLGGGGFLIYHEAKSQKTYAIDFRERAPGSAKSDMYLDSKGAIVPNRSLVGTKAVAVPGLIRGLSVVHRRFGKAKWPSLFKPAIELAEQGFVVYPTLAEAMKEKRATLGLFPATAAIFLKKDGSLYSEGDRFFQSDLAKTLKKLAKDPSSFYRGTLAREISRTTSNWISENDLDRYRVKWREPLRAGIRFAGRDYEILTMAPPSSGGVHLLQILNQLENANLPEKGFQTAASLHRIASAMQSAFVDRARYLGDPEWVKVPTRTLISKQHSEVLASSFDPQRAMPADERFDAIPVLPESSDTTHFSILDADGNAVVSTQTINGWFGSGVVVAGTGILLNNEMDDFSAKPGASNLFGAVGSTANSVQPGKTPLSSMTPTLVMEKGKPRMAVGAPGGTRIITCVAQTILNYFVYGRSLYDSVNAIRIHQQWKPDVLRIEAPGLSRRTEEKLKVLGWKLEKGKADCAVMAVVAEGKTLRGVSEPRDFGKAMGR